MTESGNERLAPGGRVIDDFDGGNSADHIYGAGDRDAITVANSADVLYGGGDNDTIPDGWYPPTCRVVTRGCL